MTKTLLIISGGDASVEVARRAKDNGHAVVVSDSDPQAPAFAFADSCLIADVHGVNETAAAAERYNRKIRKIDGVLCAADAILTAATVADRLRLPGPPLHIAELLSDRLAIHRCFASAGIAAPWATEIFTPQELQRVVIAKGRDLVLKPVENHGPDGAVRLTQVEDLNAAFQQARAHSPSERVMVEQWLDGPHVQLAALMLRGVCHVAGESEFADMAGRAASALGLGDGPMMIEIAMDQGAPHVVEVSARLCDGAFLDAAARLALGEALSPGDIARIAD
jgi:carbamoyl-phosphate synthase large subunit